MRSWSTRIIAPVTALTLILSCGACRDRNQPATGDPPQVGQTNRPIEEVLQEHTPRLMAIAGVVGTAVGSHEGAPCILVMTSGDSPALREKIPDEIEGHPVRVLVTGQPTIFDAPTDSGG
jgi:hypothetical protein